MTEESYLGCNPVQVALALSSLLLGLLCEAPELGARKGAEDVQWMWQQGPGTDKGGGRGRRYTAKMALTNMVLISAVEFIILPFESLERKIKPLGIISPPIIIHAY